MYTNLIKVITVIILKPMRSMKLIDSYNILIIWIFFVELQLLADNVKRFS